MVSRAQDGRGAAVDPVETVAALRDVPEVRDAVVTDRAGPSGATVTVAYLTGPDPSLDIGQVRQRLLSKLPRDLVPDHLVVLEEFPLTAAGEYDLAALPAPDPQVAPVRRGYVAPRTPMEEKLAAQVKQIVGVDRVGVYDSFFALGGSSLQATVLTSQIYDEFDINLSLQDMFANSTVDELAQIIIRTLGERASEQKIKERKRSIKGIGLAIHGKLPLKLRRIIPPGVPCGGSPGDGKRLRTPADDGTA